MAWTNKKIREVLNDAYGRSINGTDYEEIKDELAFELWEREDKAIDKSVVDYEKAFKAFISQFKAFKYLLKVNGDSQSLRNEIKAVMASYESFMGFNNNETEIIPF